MRAIFLVVVEEAHSYLYLLFANFLPSVLFIYSKKSLSKSNKIFKF